MDEAASAKARTQFDELSPAQALTMKRFELSGQISLRQLCLLWECSDDPQALLAQYAQGFVSKTTQASAVAA